MKRLLRLAAAAATVAIAVAACGSGSDDADSAAPASSAAVTTAAAATPSDSAGSGSGSDDGAAATATITIKDFRFGAPVTVAPGARIKVTNADTAGHDLVSDDSGKFRTPTLGQNESAMFTAPTEPGTYKFSCSLHANMTGIGTLIVQG